MTKPKSQVPHVYDLMQPVYNALLKLGRSGNIQEIKNQIVQDSGFSEDVLAEPHKGGGTELDYRLGWARTHLKKAGVITNDHRAIWSIEPGYHKPEDLKPVLEQYKKKGIKQTNGKTAVSSKQLTPGKDRYPDSDFDDINEWKVEVRKVLEKLDPYKFEHLAKRLLRQHGFTSAVVTKPSHDGGIDVKGTLALNPFIQFNVAVQCKRYQGTVGMKEINEFRGVLSNNFQQGIFITTGTFTKGAVEAAAGNGQGKPPIVLIDGDKLIDLLEESFLGYKTVYRVDTEFFDNL
ncbi:MAG: restriction endonuclease [Thermoguttaceae bacterium]|nr:restriction endonuclease [Thermoguttaceae bacterium]